MSDTTTETYVRYYREYRDGHSFDGGWFRTAGSAGDGHATAGEALAERYNHPYTDTRVVVVTTTVTTEDINDG